MASTEIPPRKSFLPPPLYSAGAGDGVGAGTRSEPPNLPGPLFLASLQDEIERSHRRQAFWMSILVHLVALVAFIDGAKLFPTQRVLVPTQTEVLQNREYTFLVLPPDLMKPIARPHGSILSDKNRVASSKQPVIDRKALRHILASSPKGTSAKPHIMQAKSSPTLNSIPPTPRAPAEVAAATPPAPIRPGMPRMSHVPGAAPATALPLAAQSGAGPVAGTLSGVAESRGSGAAETGLSGSESKPASQSNLDIISDTMGVDFGPYLSRILHEVRANWFSRIPESARAPLMKRGKVSVQFDILRTGQIAAMQVVGSSGDPSLDGAAIVGIDQSGPFPPLPAQFQGQYLALRFHFFYNPDTNDLR